MPTPKFSIDFITFLMDLFQIIQGGQIASHLKQMFTGKGPAKTGSEPRDATMTQAKAGGEGTNDEFNLLLAFAEAHFGTSAKPEEKMSLDDFEKLLKLYEDLRQAGKTGAISKLNQIVGLKSFTITDKIPYDPNDKKAGFRELKREVNPGGVLIIRFLADLGPERAARFLDATQLLKNLKDDTSASAKAAKEWLINFFEKNDITMDESLAKVALGQKAFLTAIGREPLKSLREEAIREAVSDNDPGIKRAAYLESLANYVNRAMNLEPPYPEREFGRSRRLGNGNVIDIAPVLRGLALRARWKRLSFSDKAIVGSLIFFMCMFSFLAIGTITSNSRASLGIVLGVIMAAVGTYTYFKKRS